jgi:uncharacterized protein YjiS (DUF1127 family)
MSELTTLHPSHAPAAGRLARVLAPLHRHIVQPWREWRYRRRSIAQLEALDDMILEDIGLIRGDIPTIFDHPPHPRLAQVTPLDKARRNRERAKRLRRIA